MSEENDVLGKLNLDDLNLPNYLEIRDQVVDLSEVPERGQVVLALRAFGLSLNHIGGLLKCSVSTVRGYLRRYDPGDVCTITAEGKRMITSQMLMSGAMTALMHITPQKMALSEAKDLASIACKCVMTAEKIREMDTEKKDRSKQMDAAMAYLEGGDTE